MQSTLLTTIPAAKNHLDQERKNLQSTKLFEQELDKDLHSTPTAEKFYEYISLVILFNAKTTSYVDLTGQFPYKLSRGNKYLYIFYDFDSNAILALPIKNRQAKTLTAAWETLYQRLTKTGHKTKHFITKYSVSFELTPPHMHRRNAAARALQKLFACRISHLSPGISPHRVG